MTGCKVLSKDDFIGQICEICDYSSNLDLEELKSRYPESIASRIIGTYATVKFIGKDIRQLINEE